MMTNHNIVHLGVMLTEKRASALDILARKFGNHEFTRKQAIEYVRIDLVQGLIHYQFLACVDGRIRNASYLITRLGFDWLAVYHTNPVDRLPQGYKDHRREVLRLRGEIELLQTELRYTIDQLRPLADFCVNVVEAGDEPTPMTNAIYQLVTAYDETGSISRVMNGVR